MLHILFPCDPLEPEEADDIFSDQADALRELGFGVSLFTVECARRISSPFFSVDGATREDGVERVVEIGDGQISDLVGWSAQDFAKLWQVAG